MSESTTGNNSPIFNGNNNKVTTVNGDNSSIVEGDKNKLENDNSTTNKSKTNIYMYGAIGFVMAIIASIIANFIYDWLTS